MFDRQCIATTLCLILIVSLIGVLAGTVGGVSEIDNESNAAPSLPSSHNIPENISNNKTASDSSVVISVEGTTTASGIDTTVTQVRRPDFPEEVTIYAQVENTSGGAVTGLDSADFTVTENGTEQSIKRVERIGGQSGSDVSTALTIDRSGSMSGSKLDSAEEAARDFVNRLSPNDEGLVISFSSQNRIDQRWTRNNTKLIEAIDYTGGGGTDFYGSAVRAVKQSDSRAGRSAVVALTDGKDNGGTSLSEAIITAQNRNVPIYTIGLGSGADEQALRELATDTGGEYYSAPSAQNLDAIYAQISQQIESEYRITYVPTNTATDGTIREVSATATANNAQDTGTGQYESPCAPLPTASFTTDRSGQTISFNASESSSNGGQLVEYRWDFTNNGQVDATGVTATNTYNEDGPIEAKLTVVKGCGALDRKVEIVNPSDSPNKPTAALGSDRQVLEGDVVNLDARGSSDPNGDPLDFDWEQTAGPSVQFKPQGEAVRSFLAPTVSSETTLSFEVTVNDNNGSSDTTSVDIIVEPTNAAPTAEAGPDQQVSPGTTVTLNGTASTDPDGDQLTYTWTQIDGNQVSLSGSNTPEATFEAPTVIDRETLEFELSVSDRSLSDTDSVSVEVVSTNDPPTADISLSPTPVETGTKITASAQGSTDPDNGIDSYEWSFGDGATATGERVSHTYSDPGTYTVELTVTDPVGAKDTVRKDITVERPSIQITDISREIGGTVLEGIEIDEEVSATIDSDTPVESVTFEVGGETYTDRRGSDGWAREIDLEKLDSSSMLTVTATTVNGQTVSKQMSIPVLENPSWMDTLISVGDVSVNPGSGTITIQKQVPDPPIDASLMVPKAVPVLGGPQEFEANSEFGVAYDIIDQEATLTGEGRLMVDIFDRSAQGRLGAQGTVSTTNWNLKRGKAFVSVKVDAIGRSINPGVKGGSLGAEVTVSPKVRLDIYFDDTPSGLQVTRGSVQPGAEANGQIQGTVPGFQVIGEITGDLTGYLEVPKPYRPGGTASLTATATIESSIGLSDDITLINENVGFGSQSGNAGAFLSNNGTINISSDDWELAEKYTSVPSVRAPGALSSDSNQIGVAASGTNDVRLTRDRVADQSPSIGYDATSGTTTAVWSRQNPNKSASEGRDIYVSDNDGDGWSQPTAISDDGLVDTKPSLAVDSTSGRAVVVWSRVDTAISPTDPQTPAALRNETEIVYSVREDTNSEWSTPRKLTDNAVSDVSPVIAHDASAARWQLAWQQGSSNIRLAQASDFTVGSDAGFSDRTTVQGSDLTLAAQPDGGFTLAYFESTDARNGTVVFESRTASGNVTQQRRIQTTGLRDIAVGGDTVAWVNGPAAEGAVHSLSSINAAERTVDTGNVSNVRDITLANQAGTTVLTYRGQTPGEQQKQVYYALKRGSTWLDTRPLTNRRATNLSYWQLSTAVTDGGDRFRSVFLGQNVTARQNNDVFAVDHTLRPDVSLEASATNATAGTETTVTYTVENTGDIDTDQPVDISISADGSVVDSRTADQLDPGESRSGSFTVNVPQSGTLTLAANTATEELSMRNNRVVVTPDATDLAVDNVEAERNGDNATVEVTVANTGGATKQDVSYSVTSSSGATFNGTISKMGADTTRSVEQIVPIKSVSANRSVLVTLDPADQIVEANERNNNQTTRLLRPDISLWNEGIEYENATGGANATVWVGNEGPSATPVRVTLESVSGTTVTKTINISGVGQPNATTFETVQFTNLTLGANESVDVIARSPYERRVGNNGLTSQVPPSVASSRPMLPDTDRPATDVDGDQKLEDVNGDGRANLFDALDYFNAKDSDVIKNNPSAFDFNGDGISGTIFDALALYNEIS